METENKLTPELYAQTIFNTHYLSILEWASDLTENQGLVSMSEELIISFLAKRHTMITIDNMLAQYPNNEYVKKVKFAAEDI
jgi:hypothetical protein